jgi:hypothetical protein
MGQERSRGDERPTHAFSHSSRTGRAESYPAAEVPVKFAAELSAGQRNSRDELAPFVGVKGRQRFRSVGRSPSWASKNARPGSCRRARSSITSSDSFAPTPLKSGSNSGACWIIFTFSRVLMRRETLAGKGLTAHAHQSLLRTILRHYRPKSQRCGVPVLLGALPETSAEGIGAEGRVNDQPGQRMVPVVSGLRLHLFALGHVTLASDPFVREGVRFAKSDPTTEALRRFEEYPLMLSFHGK